MVLPLLIPDVESDQESDIEGDLVAGGGHDGNDDEGPPDNTPGAGDIPPEDNERDAETKEGDGGGGGKDGEDQRPGTDSNNEAEDDNDNGPGDGSSRFGMRLVVRVPTFFFLIIPCLTCFSRNTSSYSGPSPKDISSCLDGLRLLNSETILWPSVEEQILRGPKIPVLEQLQRIASEVTRTTYHAATIVQDISDPCAVEGLFELDVVIKRGYSDGSQHVLEVSTAAGKKKLKNLLEETKRYYNVPEVTELGLAPEWFTVPFIPELRSKGEI